MVETHSDQVSFIDALTRSGVSASRWYAVIDAAQDQMLPRVAADSGLKTQSLYTGELGKMLDDVAPHLVALDLNQLFAQRLWENWGRHFGVLLQSKSSFADLRKHLRKFLLVKDENGKKFRFRYYDPRVLRLFLPACTPAETKEFYGPVECFYTESRDGRSVLAFRKSARGLSVRKLEADQLR